jgi:hypothetical protein
MYGLSHDEIWVEMIDTRRRNRLSGNWTKFRMDVNIISMRLRTISSMSQECGASSISLNRKWAGRTTTCSN